MKLSLPFPVLMLLVAVTGLVSNLRAQASFPQQPAAAVGVLGGTANFSFSFQVSVSFANLGISAYREDGTVVSSRFTITSQSVGNVISNGGNYTTGAYTIQISNLTASDVGNYYFKVSANGLLYSGSTSQLAALSISTASAPAITIQPVSQNVLAFSAGVSLSVTATGNPSPSYQWYKNGAAIAGANASNYSIALTQASDAGAYYVVVSNSQGSVTSSTAIINVASGGGPAITAQPNSLNAFTGQSVTFTVGLSSTFFTPIYIWLFNGNVIPGATGASYTLPSVTLAQAGGYSVLVSNSFGSALSSSATLSVTASTAPLITTHPVSATIEAGTNATLTAVATGTPAPTYQWRKDGVTISGAVSATLTLNAVQPSDAGSYTVTASNSFGTATSSPAVITVNVTNPAHLTNLSVLASVAAGEGLTVATVVSGSAPKPLLVRAVGPSLAAFGVSSVMNNPSLNLFQGSTLVAANDDWGGTSALNQAFIQVGAFSYQGPTTRDAAYYSSVAPNAYTVSVKDTGGGGGTVLAEIYDATPAGSFNKTTPRMINVSFLKTIAPATTATAGFVIDGTGTMQILIRGIGPGLAALGVPQTMADPQIQVFRSGASAAIASNDDWVVGLLPTMTKSGAFAIAAGSKDAALVLTLGPGQYTAQINGANNGGGTMILEIYAVP